MKTNSELDMKVKDFAAKLDVKKKEYQKKLQMMKKQLLGLKVIEGEMKSTKEKIKIFTRQINKLNNQRNKGDKVSMSMLQQFKNKRRIYQQMKQQIQNKYNNSKVIIKNLKKIQERMQKQIYRNKRAMFRLEKIKKTKSSEFEKNLQKEKTVLKNVNILASSKKRFQQRKSIVMDKLNVVKEQIVKKETEISIAKRDNADASKIQVLNGELKDLQGKKRDFEEQIFYFTENVNDITERENDVFVLPPEVKSLKEKTKIEINELKSKKSKISQTVKDLRLELNNMLTKLDQMDNGNTTESLLSEQRRSIQDQKEKLIQAIKEKREITDEINVIINDYKQKEKQIYVNKRVKMGNEIFAKLEEESNKLINIYNHNMQLRKELKEKPEDEKLKLKLDEVQNEKRIQGLKVKLIQHRLMNIEKAKQQEIRLERARLIEEKESTQRSISILDKKLLSKKLKVDTEEKEGKGKKVLIQEYFLLIDRKTKLEKKLDSINSRLNKLQVSKINSLNDTVKRLSLIIKTLSISQQNYEINMRTTVKELLNNMNQYLTMNYNISLQAQENAKNAAKL